VTDEIESDPGFAFDLSAAELRADSTDLRLLVDAFAARLENALPRLVVVRRRKVGGFRSKSSEIESITLSLGDARFELKRVPVGFECTRHEVVRGITLKHEQLKLDDWINAILRAVSDVAEFGEQARIALEGLIR
jgi:hypothetical protein